MKQRSKSEEREGSVGIKSEGTIKSEGIKSESGGGQRLHVTRAEAAAAAAAEANGYVMKKEEG